MAARVWSALAGVQGRGLRGWGDTQVGIVWVALLV